MGAGRVVGDDLVESRGGVEDELAVRRCGGLSGKGSEDEAGGPEKNGTMRNAVRLVVLKLFSRRKSAD